MRIRFTGVSTPFGGVSWEYTEDHSRKLYKRFMPGEKIKVFISSICGEPRYDKVRAELKDAIEGTSLAEVYLSEANPALSLPMEVHDTFALEDSDLCIFLIDNADGVAPEVQKQVDFVKKYGIKAVYYFCDERSSEQTVLEKSFIGIEGVRKKTVHKFKEISQNGGAALMNDIVSVYRNYCGGNIILKSEDEEFQKIGVAGTESAPVPTLPKTVLDNTDKCKEYILKFAIGHSYVWLDDGQVHTSDLDEWGVQVLTVLFEGKPIRQFNTGMFLDVLKEMQEKEHFRVVKIRWQAIQAYFAGDVSKCIEHLEKALALAKETERPLWLIHDILIDLRNQQWTLCWINNHLSEPEAQKELTNSTEEVHYPILDRINKSLHEKWIEGLFKKKIESPYSVTVGNNMESHGNLLASVYTISLYNGSLTHLLSLYEKIKMFLFYLSNKYDNWTFRRDMLKLAAFSGDKKEIDGIKNAYPEILNHLSESDASEIMQFCSNEPIDYKKVNKLLLSLGTVGYYLDDKEFEAYSNLLLLRIKGWLNDEHSIIAIGQNIFPCLSGISIRLSQDTLAEICCLFMDKDYSRWYVEMFRFMAEHIDLRKMNKSAAINLIHHIIVILEQDKGREEVKNAPRFLYMLRKQDNCLTENLDAAVLKYLPDFYQGVYKLETVTDGNQDKSWFIRDYVDRIRRSNARQGKNGLLFSGEAKEIAVIRNILKEEQTKYSSDLMTSVISVAADTVLKAEIEINEKIDGVSLLICIAVLYPEDYERNRSIYENLYEKKEEVMIVEDEFMSFNIDGISLKIGLQFLFASMGMNTSADILELLPFIQNSTATTIAVTRIIVEYLELGEKVQLPLKTEWIVLQYVLQWIQADHTDIRWNAARILMALLRNPENEEVINRKLITVIDTDNVYMKNLIMRNLYHTKGIQKATKKYIVSKCKNDSNYVVRMICNRECQKYESENEYSADSDLAEAKA